MPHILVSSIWFINTIRHSLVEKCDESDVLNKRVGKWVFKCMVAGAK